MNPYAELGIEPDADARTIQRAYRRRARETHPDAGGSSAAFERTKRASLVLLDPKRRAQYDRDGTIDDDPVDNALSEALVAISQLLDFALQVCAQQGQDPVAMNLIQSMIGMAGQAKHGLAQTARSIEHHLQLSQKLVDRFRPKVEGEPNRLALLLEQRILAQRANLAKLKHDQEVLDRAIKMLKSYTYRQERESPEQPMRQFPRMIFS